MVVIKIYQPINIANENLHSSIAPHCAPEINLSCGGGVNRAMAEGGHHLCVIVNCLSPPLQYINILQWVHVLVEEASPIYLLRLHAVTYETPNSILRLDEMPNPDASLSEVLALEHESRIIGQWSNPASGSVGRAMPVLHGKTAQSLTCSIMEKPHTGLVGCPRIPLSCFRARTSDPSGWYKFRFLQLFRIVTRVGRRCCLGPNIIAIQNTITRGMADLFPTLESFVDWFCNLELGIGKTNAN